ncbi:hypothetical protein [Paenibacillus sp. FSL K6-2859]|uniref:hypothetical protein n=1 Tax=Paenibacillus sp. FSL K6-2859 TaxID=2921482 RepID=UPI0030F60404
MDESHVNSLTYKLITGSDIEYTREAFIELHTEEFYMSMKDGLLTCEMKKHYSQVQDARNTIEVFLKTWEIDVALKYGLGELDFLFLSADVVYKDPNYFYVGEISLSGEGGLSAKMTVERGAYPTIPADFIATPDVELLWTRYKMYLQGRDQLLSMAYFCLSYIEGIAGGRRIDASNKYGVNRDDLNRLGELTSARGDKLSARKGVRNNFLPLTDEDTLWVEGFVKLLIRRIGEYEASIEEAKE